MLTKLGWFDPTNTDAQFLNLCIKTFKFNGVDCTVISNTRKSFEPVDREKWVEFSVFYCFKDFFGEKFCKVMTLLLYPILLIRAIVKLRLNQVEYVVYSSRLAVPFLDWLTTHSFRVFRLKTIYICHKPFPDFYGRPPTDMAKYSAFYESVDVVYVMNTYTKELMVEMNASLENKVVVGGHPSFLGFFDEIDRDEVLYTELVARKSEFVLLGIFSDWKGEHGLEEFFRDIERLSSSINKIGFVLFVRNCPYTEGELRAILDERGFADCFIHYVNKYYEYSELKASLEAVDLVVLPYLFATQSGILYQAKMFGKKVLVSDAGGLPACVSNYSNGIVCGKVEGIYDYIKAFDWLSSDRLELSGEEIKVVALNDDKVFLSGLDCASR